MRGGHGPIRQLQDLNWGAFDHASHAPQLRSCNYNMPVAWVWLINHRHAEQKMHDLYIVLESHFQ